LEVENFAGSPTRKIRQNKSRLDLAAGGNQFQVLRELLGDYPSSNCNFVGGYSVIPESDVVAGARSQRSPRVTNKDCIVYSWRTEKGKRKVINEFVSCSSSMLGCGGAKEDVTFSVGQAQVDGLNRPASPHCQLHQAGGESSSWVMDRIILFCTRTGLAIEGKEMELLSFLASLDSMNNKANQLVDERGRD